MQSETAAEIASSHEPRHLWVSSPITARFALVVFLVMLGLGATGMFRAALYPPRDFIASTIIDDAVFYLVPAQHLVSGQDYSFDGIHRTNGVQPLWALIAIGIAELSPDRFAALRALVLFSGFCWAGAAFILFLALRPVHPFAGCLAGTIFLLAGFSQRNALQGMENGITALFLAVVIYLGARRTFKADWKLAIALALVALCRVEALLLPAMVGLAALFGAFSEGCSKRKLHLNKAVDLLLPTFILFGAYVTLNVVHFGGLLPISGAVKGMYNQHFLKSRGWPFGGFWGNVRFQLAHPWDLGTYFIHQSMVTSLGWAHLLNLYLAIQILMALAVAAGLWNARRQVNQLLRSAWPRMWFWTVCLIYVLIHLALLTFFDPYYTLYGIWYYTPEFLLIAAVLSVGLWTATRFAYPRWKSDRLTTIVLASTCLALLATNTLVARGVTRNNPDSSMLVALSRAGEWMNDNLPPGERIGTLSSGLVSYFAPSQHVVNLDGLMNDYTYFHALQAGQVASYIDGQQIHYFSDYSSMPGWKAGFSWGGHIGLERMELLRWWIIPDGVNAYAIWRIMPRGTQRGITDPGGPASDARSKLEFAALVMNQFPVIEDGALGPYLASHPDAIVARTVRTAIGAPLKHVILTAGQFHALGWSPDRVAIDRPMERELAPGVELAGIEVPSWRENAGAEWVYTLFWRASGSASLSAVNEILIIGGKPIRENTPAYGTYPFSRWQAGEMLVETYRAQLPADLGPGTYPAYLGVQDAKGTWVSGGPVFLGDIVIDGH